MAGPAIDLVMIALLVATVVWCVRVHRRLAALRADQGEMAAFVATLAEATGRAEQAVREMKAAAAETAAAQEHQEQALRARRDELAKTLEAAQRMAQRLEEALGQGARLMAELRARQDAQPARSAPAGPLAAGTGGPSDGAPAGPAPRGAARRPVARELLEALQKLR